VPGQSTKVYAGLYKQLLLALEVALFPDTKLHSEFTTTRIEESTLTLMPKIVPDYELGYGFDYAI
jgi:hypothetical protein